MKITIADFSVGIEKTSATWTKSYVAPMPTESPRDAYGDLGNKYQSKDSEHRLKHFFGEIKRRAVNFIIITSSISRPQLMCVRERLCNQLLVEP